MKLTRELVEACRSDKGGFTSRTMRALGVPEPLVRGWTLDLIGKEISDSDYAKAIAERNKKPHPPGEPWHNRSKDQMDLL